MYVRTRIPSHLQLSLHNIHNFQHPIDRHRKLYIVPTERHTIDPLRVIVILRTRVKFKQPAQNRTIPVTEHRAQIIGKDDLKRPPLPLVHKTTPHTVMRITVSDIRLYIIYRSTVNKVGTSHKQHRTLHTLFYTQKAHR